MSLTNLNYSIYLYYIAPASLFDFTDYNDPSRRNPYMSLVFFKSAVDHISRISRILRQPRGNAMLVGQGGSGKQSTTRLGCIMGGATFTQIELTGKYKSEGSVHRVYGKHCSFRFLFLLSPYQTCLIVFVTFSSILKHPNKSFFNTINIF